MPYIQRDADGKIVGVFAAYQPDIATIYVEDNDPELSGFVSSDPSPYHIAKTTPWYRMTSDEARIMDAVMGEADAQLKQIYLAAQYLSSGDPLWQTLHQLISDNLPGGATRADEILAAE